MPPHNRFRHQAYVTAKPAAPYELLAPTGVTLPDSPVGLARLQAVGRVLRAANVRSIYLLHGTFAGVDSTGAIRQLQQTVPQIARHLHRGTKCWVDRLMGPAGNYTADYARQFEDGIADPAADPITVRLLEWSGENNHLGRAEGVVRLLDSLARENHPAGSRVLIWGHSHGGNVLALMSNFLAGGSEDRQRFFDAAGSLWRHPSGDDAQTAVWRAAREMLAEPDCRLADVALDLVTFGTPIRYGWDTGGFGRLLHFVHHRPRDEVPAYQAELPRTADDVLHAYGGDYVQHVGIAGTDFPPWIFSWRSWQAERKLGQLLEAGLKRRDLLARLECGRRVPDDGMTLLVDYASVGGPAAEQLAGHAVYTLPDWLLFHCEQIADWLLAAGE